MRKIMFFVCICLFSFGLFAKHNIFATGKFSVLSQESDKFQPAVSFLAGGPFVKKECDEDKIAFGGFMRSQIDENLSLNNVGLFLRYDDFRFFLAPGFTGLMEEFDIFTKMTFNYEKWLFSGDFDYSIKETLFNAYIGYQIDKFDVGIKGSKKTLDRYLIGPEIGYSFLDFFKVGLNGSFMVQKTQPGEDSQRKGIAGEAFLGIIF